MDPFRRVLMVIVVGVSLGVPASAQWPDALDWSTYLGGSGGDWSGCLSYAPSGHIIVAGYTESANLPLLNPIDSTYAGSSEAYFSVYDAITGALVRTSYFGGNGWEEIDAIGYDGAGNVYMLGVTSSTDLPTTAGVYGPSNFGSDDAFILKLSPDLSTILACTYVGGSGFDAVWSGASIIPHQNSVFMSFQTRSADLPATPGAFANTKSGPNDGTAAAEDSAIVKLSNDLTTVEYLTYFGGNHRDQVLNLTVNPAGLAYVTGRTRSTDFPTTVGAFQTGLAGGAEPFDVFVASFDADGSLIYSTLYGGTANDLAAEIALDGADAIISGYSRSGDLPMTIGAYQASRQGFSDVFVARFSGDGSTLLASTYLGGSGQEDSWGMSIDNNGLVYIAGSTNSSNYPVTGGAFDVDYNGGSWDMALTVLTEDLDAITYSTYIGGSDAEHNPEVHASGNGLVYIATGSTTSPDFPITAGAADSSNAGGGAGWGISQPHGDVAILRLDITPSGDSDGDGCPDWWEGHVGLNPAVNDAGIDTDLDGLTNLQEYQYGTDPKRSDPDGDGLNDFQEVITYGTNAFSADSDDDGLSDLVEVTDLDPITPGVQNPFDPNNPDSTGDSFSNTGDSVLDGANDYDGDGVSNEVEALDGTNPLDPASNLHHPALSYALGTPLAIATMGPANAGKDYTLNWAPDGTKIGLIEYTAGDYYDANTTAFVVPVSAGSTPAVINVLDHTGPTFAWGQDSASWWVSRLYPASGLRLIRLSDTIVQQQLVIPGTLMAPHFSTRPEDNFMVYTRVEVSDPNNIEALRVDANGTVIGNPVLRLTSFEANPAISIPRMSRRADKLAFGSNRFSGYVLHRVQDIINGVAAAPSSLADPRIVDLGVGGRITNFSSFSADGEAVFFSMDVIGSVTNQFGAIDYGAVDFDIAFAPVNGSTPVSAFPLVGDQIQAQISPNGGRIAYLDNFSGDWVLYVANVQTSASTGGSTVGENYGDAGNDGVNDVVVTQSTQINDVSQTTVTIPQGTVIDFPADAPQEILITTPTNPVQPAQLPAGVTGIPVTREFGPSGTQFYPPIEIAITYTDAEIEGLDEATIRVFRYNADTDLFDQEVPESDIVVRDLANNRIVFRTAHFSVYGLGAGSTPSVPGPHGVTLVVLSGMIALGAAAAMRRKRHEATS